MNKIYLLFLISLSSCSVLNPFSIKQIYEVFTVNELGILDEELKEISYSFIIIEFQNKRALLPLTEINNDSSYVWTFNEEISLVTKNGRILKTVGLDKNSEILNLYIPATSNEYERDILLYNPKSFASQIVTKIPPEESNGCLQELIETIDFKWEFLNTYCFDDRNFPSITKQEIHPQLGNIRIEYHFRF